jgi:hypothetical protein
MRRVAMSIGRPAGRSRLVANSCSQTVRVRSEPSTPNAFGVDGSDLTLHPVSGLFDRNDAHVVVKLLFAGEVAGVGQ